MASEDPVNIQTDETNRSFPQRVADSFSSVVAEIISIRDRLTAPITWHLDQAAIRDGNIQLYEDLNTPEITIASLVNLLYSLDTASKTYNSWQPRSEKKLPTTRLETFFIAYTNPAFLGNTFAARELVVMICNELDRNPNYDPTNLAEQSVKLVVSLIDDPVNGLKLKVDSNVKSRLDAYLKLIMSSDAEF